MPRNLRLLLAVFASVCTTTAVAQYPDRPIRLIVPFPPGGAADFLRRSWPEALPVSGPPVTLGEGNTPNIRLRIEPDTVRLDMLDAEWIENASRSGRIALGVKDWSSDAILLTAATEALQAFAVAHADDDEIRRAAVRVHRVDVDVGDGLIGRIERVLRVVLRSEQPLFFGGHEHKQNRAPRRFGQRSECTRDGKDLSDPCSVVASAIVDSIAARIRLADAQVVVVRGVDDGLLRQHRIAAGQRAAHEQPARPLHVAGQVRDGGIGCWVADRDDDIRALVLRAPEG